MAGTKVSSHVIADNIALGGNPTTTTQSAGNNTTRIATTAFVTGALADLSDSAPSTLNTLNELAAALGDDANFSTTVTNSIATKLPLAGGTLTGNLTISSSTGRMFINNGSGSLVMGSWDGTNHRIEGASDRKLLITSYHSDGIHLGASGASDAVLKGGKLGIGETNPDAPLHITSNTPIISFDESDASQEFRLGSFGGAFALYDSTDSAYRFTVDGSGKVGIGTTAPSQALHVAGGAGSMILNESTSWSYLRLKSPNANGGYIQFADADDDDVGQIFYYHGSGGDYMSFTTNASERVRIDSSGNLGIGTTAPAQKLHVVSAANQIRIEDSTNNKKYDLNVDSNNFMVDDMSAGVNRFAIANGGNVGIATTSPENLLHAKGTNNSAGDLGTAVGPGNIPAVHVQNAGTTDNNMAAIFFMDDASVRAGVHARFTSHSSDDAELRLSTSAGGNLRERMVIDKDGNVGIGTMTPQKVFEVQTDASSVVSVGVSQMSVNNYAGIHFGYKENNNSYRKSAIVFKRTDLTSNDAQGKVHILNGPQGSSASAGLSDRKLTIMENGNVEVPFLRAGAWSGSAMHTEGTDAIELGVSGGIGYVHGYDRNNGHYVDLAYDGTTHRFATSGGNPNVHIDAGGNMAVNVGANSGTSAITTNALMDGIAHTGTVLSNNGPVVMGRADGSNSGETGAQYNPSAEPRCIRNFFTYAGPSSNAYSSPYIHMKTNLWAGGSPSGNTEFTMSCFTFYDYYGYGANYSCYGTSGWHNWSGSYYNKMLRNYGNWDIAYDPYTSSDGYVVIVARVPNAYSQFSVDWAQWGGYNWRERKITNVSQHNAATGKY